MTLFWGRATDMPFARPPEPDRRTMVQAALLDPHLPTAPQIKSIDALLKRLSPGQQDEIIETQTFTVRGPSGLNYRLLPKLNHTAVKLLGGDGGVYGSFCIYASQSVSGVVTPADEALTKLLTIEANEGLIWATGYYSGNPIPPHFPFPPRYPGHYPFNIAQADLQAYAERVARQRLAGRAR